jgi:hypothetical protein
MFLHNLHLLTCKIAQIIGTRIKLAYALAKQWFGIYTSAEEPNDGNSFLAVNSCSYYLLKNTVATCQTISCMNRMAVGWFGWFSNRFIYQALPWE